MRWEAVFVGCCRSVHVQPTRSLFLADRLLLGPSSQEYNVLLTQLETLFLTSPTFTLQKTFFHLHPTIHTLSLLHSLTNQLFHADEDDESESDDDDSSVNSDEARLGLGGNRMKDLTVSVGGGLVKGGEVLGLIWQMGRNRSGSVHLSRPFTTAIVSSG